MFDRFIRYTLQVKYQVQGRRFVKDGYIIYRPKEKDVEEFTTAYILPLETPPQCDQQGFLEYLRTQLDKLYTPDGLLQAEQRGAIAYTENMYSSIEPIEWQDLTRAERLEYLENKEAGFYDEALKVIRRAANVFRQLDSGAPDPLLVSQTPAQDAATKNAAQPPAVAVVDADAEQTDLAAQTPATSKQAGKKPRAGSGGRKQKNHRVTRKDLQRVPKLIKKNPDLTNKEICAILGVNPNCAGKYKDGTKKELRVVIDNAREDTIGNYYLTGKEQDRAADAFLEENATSRFKHKRQDNED